jgi:hypothetical protein
LRGGNDNEPLPTTALSPAEKAAAVAADEAAAISAREAAGEERPSRFDLKKDMDSSGAGFNQFDPV